MKFVRITDPLAVEVVAAVSDETVSAVEREEAMAAEVAEIDRLIDDVDRELAAQERTEAVRVSRAFTDVRQVRRARRRADRVALRTLPGRVDVSAAGEVAA
ncbi:hypothetical protein [Haloechinothrix salitolerans]|uniref:Uncharacterized protein n=1 Tax=Haloechinothrix salitolerans TaxID=926830 RepID=A0ABW2BUZ7_9PSEU